MERFALLLLKEKGLLGRVNLPMHAVTMCCFKFTEISGIAFGCRRTASGVERALWIADGAQLSIWDLLQPAFPSACWFLQFQPNFQGCSRGAVEPLASCRWCWGISGKTQRVPEQVGLCKTTSVGIFLSFKVFLVLWMRCLCLLGQDQYPGHPDCNTVAAIEMECYETDSLEAFSIYFLGPFCLWWRELECFFLINSENWESSFILSPGWSIGVEQKAKGFRPKTVFWKTYWCYNMCLF